MYSYWSEHKLEEVAEILKPKMKWKEKRADVSKLRLTVNVSKGFWKWVAPTEKDEITSTGLRVWNKGNLHSISTAELTHYNLWPTSHHGEVREGVEKTGNE